MQSLTPIQKIDEILNFFKSNKKWIESSEIYTHYIHSGHTLHNEDLEMIIAQLLKDGYIHSRVAGAYNTTLFYITYHGYLFPGYQDQDRTHRANIVSLTLREKGIIQNERSLRYATWFAAVVGLLLFLWQIAVYFWPEIKK